MADEYLQGIMAKTETEKTMANGWWKQASMSAKDGRRIEVWQLDGVYVVEFYNHQGVFMDASTHYAPNLVDAMTVATNAIKECDSHDNQD